MVKLPGSVAVTSNEKSDPAARLRYLCWERVILTPAGATSCNCADSGNPRMSTWAVVRQPTTRDRSPICVPAITNGETLKLTGPAGTPSNVIPEIRKEPSLAASTAKL